MTEETSLDHKIKTFKAHGPLQFAPFAAVFSCVKRERRHQK